jgi:hypothetical protein
VIGAIGVVYSIVAYYQQRKPKPKRLDYRILNRIQIVSRHARGLPQTLEVRYGGVPLDDPRIVLLRIENTGVQSVKRDDFVGDDAVEVLYERDALIQARVVDTSPNLSTDNWGELSVEGRAIRVAPYLLNAGEYIDIQMLFEHFPGDIRVKARFADQESPMQELDAHPTNEIPNAGTKLAIMAAVATTLALAGTTFGYAVLRNSQP